jgi:hypothetical protein
VIQEPTRLLVAQACKQADVHFGPTTRLVEVTPNVYRFVSEQATTAGTYRQYVFHAIVKGYEVDIERV